MFYLVLDVRTSLDNLIFVIYPWFVLNHNNTIFLVIYCTTLLCRVVAAINTTQNLSTVY